MAKEPKGELVLVEKRFDYSSLEAKVAQRMQTAAERIREAVKRTTEGIIEVGNELLEVKDALPHGEFGTWLRAEFGWTDRTARNFMAVAERFGPKTEIISEMKIDPTAAYLLAAPSAPDEAREKAIKLAEGGDRITTKVAKKILADFRKKGTRKGKTLSAEKLGPKLEKVLVRFRDRWSQNEVAELARRLREFADSLESDRGGKKKAKS